MSILVNLKTLPSDIYKKIPLSIRAYSDTYEYDDLPFDIQGLIAPYITNTEKEIIYDEVYDIIPTISEFGDFTTVTTKKKLILEHLKNYLLTLPNDYPFDPLFGSTLRKHLHMKDTATRKLLITQEIENITNVLSNDLDINISLLGLSINNLNKGIYSQYDIQIDLKIEDEQVSIATAVTF